MRLKLISLLVIAIGFATITFTHPAVASTPTPTPATSQISDDLKKRLYSYPSATIFYIHVAENYAVADYSIGESGGDAFYIVAGSKWKYVCTMKGGVDLSVLESSPCKIPSSVAKELFPN